MNVASQFRYATRGAMHRWVARRRGRLQARGAGLHAGAPAKQKSSAGGTTASAPNHTTARSDSPRCPLPFQTPLRSFRQWLHGHTLEAALQAQCGCAASATQLRSLLRMQREHAGGQPVPGGAGLHHTHPEHPAAVARTTALRPGGEVTRRFLAPNPVVLQVGSGGAAAVRCVAGSTAATLAFPACHNCRRWPATSSRCSTLAPCSPFLPCPLNAAALTPPPPPPPPPPRPGARLAAPCLRTAACCGSMLTTASPASTKRRRCRGWFDSEQRPSPLPHSKPPPPPPPCAGRFIHLLRVVCAACQLLMLPACHATRPCCFPCLPTARPAHKSAPCPGRSGCCTAAPTPSPASCRAATLWSGRATTARTTAAAATASSCRRCCSGCLGRSAW